MTTWRRTAIQLCACAILLTGLSAAGSMVAADQPIMGAQDQLVRGYSEQYAFNIGGKSIGTQSATLIKVDGGQQTWTFSIDLSVPTGGAPLLIQQSGTFVVDSAGRAVSLDTTAAVGGASQAEKLVFAGGNVTCTLNPSIPSIAPVFPVAGHPYLIVGNLITLMSLEARSVHGNIGTGISLDSFNANALRPMKVILTPKPGPGDNSNANSVYQANLAVPGLPQATFTYWLSNTTGEITKMTDDAQSLTVTKM